MLFFTAVDVILVCASVHRANCFSHFIRCHFSNDVCCLGYSPNSDNGNTFDCRYFSVRGVVRGALKPSVAFSSTGTNAPPPQHIYLLWIHQIFFFFFNAGIILHTYVWCKTYNINRCIWGVNQSLFFYLKCVSFIFAGWLVGFFCFVFICKHRREDLSKGLCALYKFQWNEASCWSTESYELTIWMYVKSFLLLQWMWCVCFFSIWAFYFCAVSARFFLHVCISFSLLVFVCFLCVCVCMFVAFRLFVHFTIFAIHYSLLLLLLLSFSVITIFNDSYANWVKFYGLRVQININYLCCCSFFLFCSLFTGTLAPDSYT